MADEYFIRPLDHARARDDKAHKHTFLLTDRLLAGLNSLLPGQRQPIHDHPHQDKFYYVLEGTGLFSVGDESESCGQGMMILAPAGVEHGVTNEGDTLLTFLTVIAPFPTD